MPERAGLANLVQKPSPPKVEQTLPPQQETAPFAGVAGVVGHVDHTRQKVLNSLTELANSVAITLDELQANGIRAMQGGNFDEVSVIMEQGKRLKNIKDRIAHLAEEIEKE